MSDLVNDLAKEFESLDQTKVHDYLPMFESIGDAYESGILVDRFVGHMFVVKSPDVNTEGYHPFIYEIRKEGNKGPVYAERISN